MKTPDEYINPQDGRRYCNLCHTPRESIVHVAGQTFRPQARCKCQKEVQAAEKAQQKQQEFLDELQRMKAHGLQDKALPNYCFANDNGKNRQLRHAHTYVDQWAEMAKKGQGFLLWGDVGTGKSFFAGCIANALLERGVPVLMTTTGRILNAVTGVYSEERNYFLNSIQRYDLLILDDLGMERTTEFATEQIFNVVDNRYRSGKPMIVTSNLSLETWQNPSDMAHKRIYSRVLERCIPLKINGTNIRATQAENNMEQAKTIFK